MLSQEYHAVDEAKPEGPVGGLVEWELMQAGEWIF
jgi:hypothetical protein